MKKAAAIQAAPAAPSWVSCLPLEAGLESADLYGQENDLCIIPRDRRTITRGCHGLHTDL